MSLRKILFVVGLAAAAASLMIGLALAGQWLLALAVLLPAVVMLLANKYPDPWNAPIALVLFVGLAATGVLLGAPSIWMLSGAIFSLAAWDLAQWSHAGQGDFSPQTQVLENKHFRSLLLVVILGGAAAGAGQFLRLQVSFWVILLLVLAAFYCLDRIIRQLSSGG